MTTSKSKIVRTCSEIFGDPQKSNEMIFQSLLLRWYRGGSTKVTHTNNYYDYNENIDFVHYDT